MHFASCPSILSVIMAGNNVKGKYELQINKKELSYDLATVDYSLFQRTELHLNIKDHLHQNSPNISWGKPTLSRMIWNVTNFKRVETLYCKNKKQKIVGSTNSQNKDYKRTNN